MALENSLTQLQDSLGVRAHDARVLRNSNIYQEAEQGNILQAPWVDIDGNDIGLYLLIC